MIVYCGLGLPYSAHPVSYAARLETLKIYEDENLLENAANMSRYVDEQVELLKQKTSQHWGFQEYRFAGLYRAGEEQNG